ncbi:MAG: PorV/PorQ family protein, partial [Ignavibacteriales bacterium]|nr:PorV/PorQ family protein [Ignavibacteriales bacterium]
MKNLLTIFIAACFFATASFPQKVGTTSMQFLKVMPCARGTALGDAYSVLAEGAEAVFWNPSGIALVQKPELSSTYLMWMMDSKIGAISYAAPLADIGAFGVSLQYVDYGEMEETIWNRPYSKFDPYPGRTGRSFHPYAYVAGISYAANLTDKFSTGLSVKYAYESLFNGKTFNAMISQGICEEVNTWGSGLLFDFGMRYNTGYKSVQLGIAIQNFGADITYAKEASAVPLQFRWGVAADLLGKDALFFDVDDNRLSFAFDLFQPNDYAQQEHVGIEYEFSEVFALRGGYKFNYDSEGLTAGFGVQHNFASVHFSFDYSYGSVANFLGDVHRISLG